MIRKIIKIDGDKCNGCGLCAEACHEGAIGMVNGKAKLLHEHYCDGLGDCLPACPTDAISFEERDAPAYDEAAVKANMARAGKVFATEAPPKGGCPGSNNHSIKRVLAAPVPEAQAAGDMPSRLNQWPVQIKLAAANAPYFDGAKLLIAADCTAYAYAGFHDKFMKDRVTLIGCPKLDEGDYSDKLTAILKENTIKSVTVVRMEVPCCAGIANAAVKALQNCGKMIPWQVVTLSTDGRVIED